MPELEPVCILAAIAAGAWEHGTDVVGGDGGGEGEARDSGPVALNYTVMGRGRGSIPHGACVQGVAVTNYNLQKYINVRTELHWRMHAQ